MSYCAIYGYDGSVTLTRGGYVRSGIFIGEIAIGDGYGKLKQWDFRDIATQKFYTTIKQFLAEHFDKVL